MFEGDGGILSGLGRLARLPKLLKFAKVARLLKLLKVSQVQQFVTALEINLGIHQGMSRLFNIFFLVILVTHMVACGWTAIARNFIYTENDQDCSGDSPDLTCTWIQVSGRTTQANFRLHMASLYWAISTLATVGYGDISARTPSEQGYAMIMMLVGVSWYAIIVSSFSGVVQSFDSDGRKKHEKMRKVNAFIHDQKLPQPLARRVRIYCQNLYENKMHKMLSDYSSSEIFGVLPSLLKSAVILHVEEGLIERIPFFRDKTADFVTEMLEIVHPVYMQPDEFVICQGARSDEMFFLTKGKVKVVREQNVGTPNDGVGINVESDSLTSSDKKDGDGDSGTETEQVELAVLGEGSYFGECGLILDEKRGFSVKTLASCELLMLSRAAFGQLKEKYPDAASELVETALIRRGIYGKDGSANGSVRHKKIAIANIARAGGAALAAPHQMIGQTTARCLEVSSVAVPSVQMSADAMNNNRKIIQREHEETGERSIRTVHVGTASLRNLGFGSAILSPQLPEPQKHAPRLSISFRAAEISRSKRLERQATNPTFLDAGDEEDDVESDTDEAGGAHTTKTRTAMVRPLEVAAALAQGSPGGDGSGGGGRTGGARRGTISEPIDISTLVSRANGIQDHDSEQTSSSRLEMDASTGRFVIGSSQRPPIAENWDGTRDAERPQKPSSSDLAALQAKQRKKSLRDRLRDTSSETTRKRRRISLLKQDARRFGERMRAVRTRRRANKGVDPGFLDDDERVERMCFVLLPDGQLRTCWDVYEMFVLFFIAFYIPFRATYLASSFWQLSWECQMIEYLITATFAFSIALTVVTAYIDNSGRLVVAPTKIVIRYLRFHFWVDVIATFPFDMVFDDGNSALSALGRLTKLPRVLRLAKITRLLKLLRVSHFQNFIAHVESEYGIHQGFSRLFNIGFLVILATHIVACGWSAIGMTLIYQEEEGGYSCFENPELMCTWIQVRGMMSDEVSRFRLHMASLYWAFSTLTTVGYGDISARTPSEQGYAMIMMLIGVSWYAFVVSSFSGVVQSFDSQGKKIHDKMRKVNAFILDQKLPHPLARRVRAYLQHLYENRMYDMMSDYDASEIFGALPSVLRNAVVLHVQEDSVEKIPFFHNKMPDFIAEVLEHLQPTFIPKGEFILKEGTKQNEMFFLIRGSVTVSIKRACGTVDNDSAKGADIAGAGESLSVRMLETMSTASEIVVDQSSSDARHEKIVLTTLCQGSYFGESVLLPDRPLPPVSEMTAETIAACDLQALSMAGLRQLCAAYPDVASELIETAKARDTVLLQAKGCVGRGVRGHLTEADE